MYAIFIKHSKESSEVNARHLKEKDDEIYDLKCQLTNVQNIKINSQELHEHLIYDYKKTITVWIVQFK